MPDVSSTFGTVKSVCERVYAYVHMLGVILSSAVTQIWAVSISSERSSTDEVLQWL